MNPHCQENEATKNTGTCLGSSRARSTGASTSDEIGGSNGRVGRIRPHVHHFTGGFEESQGVDACAPSGRAHCVFENVHQREEEDRILPRRGRPGTGSFGPGSGKTSIRGAKFGRRRSTFGGPHCGIRGVEGGSSSDLSSHHFRPRVGSCEHVFHSYDRRIPIFVASCSPEGEAAKKEIANRPGICHIRPSIWPR